MMQHPAQSEPAPSPGPKPDLDTMKAVNAAISSNEKIFPVFAQKLASGDLKDFVQTAHKLAVWLGSEKAYYPVARPKIVKLIEVARSTFINLLIHHTSAAEAARKLVDAITPFSHLFTEDELHSRLHRVLSDANLSISVATSGAPHANVNPQGSTDANVPVVHPPPMLPISLEIQPSNTVQAISGGLVHADTLQVMTPLEAAPVAQIKPTPSLVPSIVTIAQDSETISPNAASKPHPRRARRVELSEELIARDLDWFKSQQGSAAVKDEPSVSASFLKPEQFSPTLPSQISPILQRSPSPKKKTARMVPSRRLPRRVLFSSTEEAESGGSASAPPTEPPTDTTASLKSTEDMSVQMDVDKQHSSSNSHAHPPETTLNSGEQIEASCSDHDSEGVAHEPPSKAVSTPLQFSEELRLRTPVLPPLVGAFDPPLNLDFALPLIPRPPEVNASQRRFDGQMAVIHSLQGKPFIHTHVIEINFNESMYSKTSKWANRKLNPSEAPEGVCITLACYRLSEFFDTIKSESGKVDVRELMSRSSCSWPSSRLSLHLDNDGRVTTIPLSPPHFLTPEGCVDLTSSMKLGKNSLEIRQDGDTSAYLVALLAHVPTKAQLAEVEVVKAVDERWKRLLDVLSARVTLKIRSTPESVPGVF